jgi:hypothetical protein
VLLLHYCVSIAFCVVPVSENALVGSSFFHTQGVKSCPFWYAKPLIQGEKKKKRKTSLWTLSPDSPSQPLDLFFFFFFFFFQPTWFSISRPMVKEPHPLLLLLFLITFTSFFILIYSSTQNSKGRKKKAE